MPDANNKKNTSGGIFDLTNEVFQVTSPTAEVCWDFGDVRPWAPQYIALEDSLLVTVTTGYVGYGVVVNLRILRLDGEIVAMSLQAPGGAALATLATKFPLVEGFILSCNVQSAANYEAGVSIYASVQLVRNPGGQGSCYATLCAGYCGWNWGFGYPQSPVQRPSDGLGRPYGTDQAPPAAGADVIFSCPAGLDIRVTSVTATLVTAVAVANRYPTLIVDDGVDVYMTIPAPAVQLASTTVVYTWGEDLAATAVVNGVVTMPLPNNLLLESGDRIRTSTAGIAAADQWSAMWILSVAWARPG